MDKPHVLDDAMLDRIIVLYSNQLEDHWLFLAIQLVSATNIMAHQKLDYNEQIGSLLLINIDLNTVRQPLLSEIMKYGKLLKGEQLQYAELAIKNVNTGQDFLPYIKRMMAERRQRHL